jgi:hypothetical protein
MKCDECGTPASEQDLFCAECGAVLAAPAVDEVAETPAYELPLDQQLPPALPSGQERDATAAPDSRARIALILGIVSIGSVVLTCLPIFGLIGCVGPVVGIAAIILGAIVKRDVRARGGLEQDWKRANLGMVLGVAGLALYFVFLALTIVLGIGLEFLRGV